VFAWFIEKIISLTDLYQNFPFDIVLCGLLFSVAFVLRKGIPADFRSGSHAPQDIDSERMLVWVRNGKGGKQVLRYLGRCVHRVAIGNRRITMVSQGRIGFGYKDSQNQKWRTTSLPAMEFMRRFLQHVLPPGFNKVRYYGLLSPTNRHLLRRLQLLLNRPEEPRQGEKQAAQEA
jgi:hypothetical protein